MHNTIRQIDKYAIILHFLMFDIPENRKLESLNTCFIKKKYIFILYNA